MNDDDLRIRLARLDPQATSAVDPITSPRAQDLLESTMTSTETPTDTIAPAANHRRRYAALTAAAAVTAAAVGVGIVASRSDSTPTPLAKKTTLSLSLPDPLAMSSCLPFAPAVLKDFPIAFAGTVTSVEGDTVSLDVTKWYAGGTAQVVTLTNPGGNTSVALEGVAFADGKDYLVSATNGNVNGCGFSGEDSGALRAGYDEAFGG